MVQSINTVQHINAVQHIRRVVARVKCRIAAVMFAPLPSLEDSTREHRNALPQRTPPNVRKSQGDARMGSTWHVRGRNPCNCPMSPVALRFSWGIATVPSGAWRKPIIPTLDQKGQGNRL